MCLAIPGRILEIDNTDPGLRMAKVDFSGVVKDICVQWVPQAGVGDYVLVHVGTALNTVDEEDALATLKLLREMDEPD